MFEPRLIFTLFFPDFRPLDCTKILPAPLDQFRILLQDHENIERCRYCGQLVNLDLGCSIINADITPILESVADKLEQFSLESTSWVNEQDAEKVRHDKVTRSMINRWIPLGQCTFRSNEEA